MQRETTFQVFENDLHIGDLARTGMAGYSFSYDPEYIREGGHELCVTMPLSEEPYIYEGLPPFFTNLLSEGWLSDVQSEHAKGVFSSTAQPVTNVVARFGQRCFGAFQLRLKKEATHTGTVNEPWGNVNDEFYELALEVGQGEEAMIPGAYPKILAVQAQDGSFRMAQAGEASTHIAKLQHADVRMRGIVDSEYLATQVVQHLLPDDEVCEVSFAPLEGAKDEALLIKRFDRGPNNEMLPFYEFNQLLGKHVDDKYNGSFADMADYIYEHAGPEGKNGVKCDISDARKLFRRVLADFMIGNADGHLKNYALAKGQDGVFRLTPNYDKVSSVFFSEGRRERFVDVALDVGGRHMRNIGDIDAKRVIMMGYEFQLNNEEIIEDVRSLGKQAETVQSVIDANKEVNPRIAKELAGYIQKRWRGSFSQVEAVLAKNKPKNVFEDKTSRAQAEASLAAAGVSRSWKPSNPNNRAYVP